MDLPSNTQGVPCKHCGTDTNMTGACLCDRCWNLANTMSEASAELTMKIFKAVHGERKPRKGAGLMNEDIAPVTEQVLRRPASAVEVLQHLLNAAEQGRLDIVRYAVHTPQEIMSGCTPRLVHVGPAEITVVLKVREGN